MAEFRFYCISENYSKVINAVCENADWGVMPCWHSTRSVPVYRHYSADLEQAITTNKTLYVVGPFSIEGICVEETSLGNYSVTFQKWGPLISLTLGGSSLGSGLEHVWSTDVYYNQWYETKDGRHVKPTDEVKAAYADIVKRIKRICHRMKVQKWVYVTEDVRQLLQDRRGVVKVDGQWLGIGNFNNKRNKLTSGTGE